MRCSILCLFFLMFGTNCLAEQSYQAPLVRESLLLDIDATDYAVAVGERGHVLVKDNDEQFSQIIVPTQATLTAVTLLGNHVWAAGHDAVILHSADRGANWQLQHHAPELERPFLDILFFDQHHGIAIGAYGLFYRTKDGGQNWQAERHATLLNPLDQAYLEDIRKEDEAFYQQELDSILPHLNRIIKAQNNTLYLAGEAGLLAVSTDLGQSWQRYEIEYYGSFFDIALLRNGTLVAAGLRGHIFSLAESGQWQQLVTCNTTTINSIVEHNNRVYFIGNNGVIVKTQLPFKLTPFDPYQSSSDCELVNHIDIATTQSKAPLLNAILLGDNTIVTAGDGIYSLTLD